MKSKRITFILLVFCMMGCRKVEHSFVPCQSFDELNMTEVVTDNLSEPFVWVQRQQDIIKVVKSDFAKDTMTYVYTGKFWYSSVQIRYSSNPIYEFINNLRTPQAWDTNYKQLDVYRYAMNGELIEVFLFSVDTCSIPQEIACLPNYICVHSATYSKGYTFFNDLKLVLDTTILNNSIIGKAWNQNIYDEGDTSCIFVTKHMNPLSSLRCYHVSAKQQRCTTLETLSQQLK